LVFATNNAHNLDEVRAILKAITADNGVGGFEVLSLKDINCHEDIPEDADTLEGNALQKACYIKEHYGYDCFADDTGLEVTALEGAPGVYSARYASLFNSEAASHDSEANMHCLLSKLNGATDRSAQFRTAIALIYKGETNVFEGIVRGSITTERHGADGFGYDPIFQPEGYDKTFAELGNDIKNTISHRGRATRELAEFLKGRI
jgi:XTP/dITP diphosphohydrolase